MYPHAIHGELISSQKIASIGCLNLLEKAPWHGVSSEGEFIDNCITVLLCITTGLLWPLNWNGLNVVDSVSRIVYAVILGLVEVHHCRSEPS